MSETADASVEKKESESRAIARKRLWMFRALACGLPLLVFLIAEVSCRLLGIGNPSLGPDPFAGFQEVRPLFILDQPSGEYRIPESRYNFFAPESFSKEKQSNTRRVFCLGGSTVQGRPYSTPTAFSTFLQLALDQADTSQAWNVINCGGISYASYRLVPILREVLTYQPDLIVLCTGHNEFLEDRSYHHLKDKSSLLSRALQMSSKSWLFNAACHLVYADSNRSDLPTETDPMLDYHNGLAAYHRDDAWHANVMAHFEHNVRRLVEMARNADVPIVIVVPPSNLYDCPPIKSTIRKDLKPKARERLRQLIEQARNAMRSDVQRAILLFKEAAAIDGRHAATWYELGKCYHSLGLHSQADEAFVLARDEDICPLRMLSQMEEQVRQITAVCDVPILDLSVVMRDGHDLVDHVHPDFEGHQNIAKRLVEVFSEHGWCQLKAGWQIQVDQCFSAHMESLEDFYYLKGQRTLNSLQGWTEGRADGPPAEDRFPHRIP